MYFLHFVLFWFYDIGNTDIFQSLFAVKIVCGSNNLREKKNHIEENDQLNSLNKS